MDEVKRLLDLGVDPNFQGQYRLTHLHHAAYRGNERVCEILLQYGAKVDALDCVQNTPLHNAASMGHEKVCEVLLKHGANKNLRNNKGITPSQIAKNPFYHKSVVKILQ